MSANPATDHPVPDVVGKIPGLVTAASRAADQAAAAITAATAGAGGMIHRLGAGAKTATDAAADAATDAAGQAVDLVGRPADPAVFERDALGDRVVRGEVLALSPTAQSLALAQGMNFTVLRNEAVPGLGQRIVVLGAPPGLSATAALNALQTRDPAGAYALNHIYNPGASALTVSTPPEELSPAAVPSDDGTGLVIGMVDGGIDMAHPDLAGAHIVATTLAGDGTPVPTAHGTAIAGLLVGRGKSAGVVPDATLYAADVFGGEATGGAADTVIRGLAWTAARGAKVINVSLVGPPNPLLAEAIKALQARGCVIVAAVGNDGPATPVEYPAAYDGVIAVTSVDHAYHIQLDANRGPQMAFASYGVGVRVATTGARYGLATGTSFAAPLVAARLDEALSADHRPARAEAALRAAARDLGAPGRDPVFGYGFLAPRAETTTTASRD